MARLKERKEISSLLRPDIISSISGLEFMARIIVEEFFHGNNHSHRLGVGQEFSQYRSYEPGDDMRLLDWKVYARSERYYIRQSEVDTHITIRFIIDTSRSMAHESDGITKIDLAKVLVASLSYLAKNQGDAIGLFSINKENTFRLSPNIHPQQFVRLLRMLLEIKTESVWPTETMGLEEVYHSGRKELIVFLSDLFEKEGEIMSFLKTLKSTRNEVLVLHLTAGNESEFGFDGFHTFKDLETGEEIMTDSTKARSNFIQQRNEFLKEVKTSLTNMEIDYQVFDTMDDLPKILSGFLMTRKRLQ